MLQISAAEFREHCLWILDHLPAEGLIIIRRGKPVAQLLPYLNEPSNLIGCLKNEIEVKGDILSTGLNWMPLINQS